MAVKLRITHTITREYEPNPEHYPGCNTARQMADLDEAIYGDVPTMIPYDMGVDGVAVSTKVEVVE